MDVTALQRARALIAERTGLRVRPEDQALLARVLTERATALRLADAEQYCRLLAADKDIHGEREALVGLLTAGETFFFRDEGLHALLRSTILPELIARAAATRRLRIWSAGCSSGEEAYSLAILLDELLPDQSGWHILLLGTDINQDAIARARAGRYGDWSFRSASDERRQRHFQRAGNTWTLRAALRDRVTFAAGDLLTDPFPYAPHLRDMDLILCRNTFIYMVPEAIATILGKFTETLSEGGMLITGHGELHAHHLGRLRTRVFAESILYQKVPADFHPAARAMPVAAPPERPATVTRAQVPARPRVAPPPPPPAGEAAATAMQKAWDCANQGRREQAEQACRALIAGDPPRAEPHYLLALLAQEQGDYASAKTLLKKVIYLDASLIAAYLELSDLYEREGDSERAARMRRTALGLLRALPRGDPVRFYGTSTVSDVMRFVERLLVKP